MGRSRYKIYEPTHFGNFDLCMHYTLGKVERAKLIKVGGIEFDGYKTTNDFNWRWNFDKV
jgi:hypothetical protein